MASTLASFKGELKSQVAEEAARDPNSKFSAEDAERVMVQESVRAGATAIKFDPNASPSEKAAQAAARKNDTQHHRTKGVGIATDMAGGPDDYDLPPPVMNGALMPPNASSEQAAAPNGVPPEEVDHWKKVGHPPRFGTGETASIKDEPSLLDHQTWVETQLDDKFFGDWYHNAGVIIFACLASWVVAVLGGGLGWLFIVMATCGTYYRTSLRRTRRNFRDDITRELAKARLETETETLEWMNSFLVKFWPIYAPNLGQTIIQMVDQILSTSTPAFLDSMRLDAFILGTKPPRMEHVKTYPKAEDDIVLMDWKFSFTPTDVLDMTQRQLASKINPKVVLEIRIGKGVVSKAMKIIVENFAVSGLMRLKIKLGMAFPHIERVDMCFLERPDIDYVCKPLGGETFGFDINFIPGLESFIKEQIHANLGPMMYAPNVFPIEVAKILSGTPVDLAVGVVAVTIHGANGLKNTDNFSGTPDPYAVVSLNNTTALGRTKTIHENANPRWNETLYVIITNYTDDLTLSVFDYNEVRKDKELGIATFPLEALEHAGEHQNKQLEVLSGGKPRGVVQCDIRFFPVIEAAKAADGTEMPSPEFNTGIARITVEQAKELDGSKSMVGALNPYAVLLVNGKEVHISGKLKRTNNPIFPNPSKSVLITDRKRARIGLVVKDDRDVAKDPIVGAVQIKLDDMIKAMLKGQQWFPLAGVKSGRVKLALEWKPVALKGVVGGSGGYVTPIGVMRVHLKSASDLRNFETMGKSDPYARLMLSGIEKGRTVTFRNNLNPTWDEVIYVPVRSPLERITIEVMDEEKLGKDRSLGLLEIPLAEYIKQEEDGEYHQSGRKDLSDGLRLNGRGAPKGKLDYILSFFPLQDVADPEEEAAEKAADAEAAGGLKEVLAAASNGDVSANGKTSQESARPPVELRKSLEVAGRPSNVEGRPSLSPSVNGSYMNEKKRAKLRIGPEDLSKYESGLLVFNIVEGQFAHSNLHLEVIVDGQAFPSYVSGKTKQRVHQFGETGDAFIRELEYSKITLRLVKELSKSGEDDEEHVMAKLTGNTLSTLQTCLDKPTQLAIRGNDGSVNTVIVKLRYLPIEMQLDPSESINNSGTLRVEVLDAAELPAADRNGFSDPYCKFKLHGKEIYKTKVQKKTLHPAWNEYFETQISSRVASDLRCDVYDWDLGDKDDFLGGTPIDLKALEPFIAQEFTYALDGKSGVVRLKMVFKPSYVTRARQGSSTLSGTFAPAGKVVGAPVKGVTKVGGAVGGGVIKGASFLKRGFTGRSHSRDEPMVVVPDEGLSADSTGVSRASTRLDGSVASLAPPMTPQSAITKSRTGSVYGSPPPNGVEIGTASFTVVSASGYPPSADVRVYIRMGGSRGMKEVHKTKAIKSSSGVVEYDASHESFKVPCAADTQFQAQVKDHGTFGSKDLGEGSFFVSDQGAGSEQVVTAGAGTVTLRTHFATNTSHKEYEESLRPGTARGDEDKKESRRSFFGRRDVSGKHDEK